MRYRNLVAFLCIFLAGIAIWWFSPWFASKPKKMLEHHKPLPGEYAVPINMTVTDGKEDLSDVPVTIVEEKIQPDNLVEVKGKLTPVQSKSGGFVIVGFYSQGKRGEIAENSNSLNFGRGKTDFAVRLNAPLHAGTFDLRVECVDGYIAHGKIVVQDRK